MANRLIMTGTIARIGIRHRVFTIFFTASALADISPHAALGQKPSFLALGQGQASCGEFLRAVEGERQARVPSDPINSYRYPIYGQYVNFADGFITGANWVGSGAGMLGEGTDHAGRMAWLENYCRQHPLNSYVSALIGLKASLGSRPLGAANK